MILSHDPAGTSTKTVIHYAQEIHDNGDFQFFDYGKEGNIKEYGTSTPPQYRPDKILVPTFLMYAENDWLASPIVSTLLLEQLDVEYSSLHEMVFKICWTTK